MQTSLFTPPSFLARSNIYEVNIRQYTTEGTFNAFANHLPRLADMGVEILWLMPIFPIGLKNRKGTLGSYYSISNYKAINFEFGSVADFRELVTKAHALGMKIILDWVANHTAWDNVWTKTNPDFYTVTNESDFISPYDWDDVIQLNHESDTQQYAMIDAMKYWITEFNIDGFRADMAHLIPLQFWKNARAQLSILKEDLIWLAETENVEYTGTFDISYTWEWMHASEKMCKQQISLINAVNVLHGYKNNFAKNHHRLFFTSNHDENSWTATEYEKYGAFTKTMAVFTFLYISVPLIYSGQELPNYKRLQFFDKDVIEWRANEELHQFYKTLLDVRKRNKLLFANPKIEFNEDALLQNILCYTIKNDFSEILICLNFREEHTSFAIKNLVGNYLDVFCNKVHNLHNEYIFNADSGSYLVLEKIIS